MVTLTIQIEDIGETQTVLVPPIEEKNGTPSEVGMAAIIRELLSHFMDTAMKESEAHGGPSTRIKSTTDKEIEAFKASLREENNENTNIRRN
jgi:hypothetical protein